MGFLSAVAAVGAGQWDQSDVEDVLKVVFHNKRNSEQQMREEAAAFQNEIEEYITQNDRYFFPNRLASRARSTFVPS